MKRNRNSAFFAGLLLLAALSACGKTQQNAPAPEPGKPHPVRPAQGTMPVQGQLSSAGMGAGRLDFGKRTDPFKPYAPAPLTPPPQGERPAAGRVAPGRLGEALPIQSYDVTKFKVIGIVAGLRENRALLVDPAGKAYVVHEGMTIGSNEGRITRITSSGVEVVERFREDHGRIRKRKIVLSLAKKR